ncbi:hypothetical protein SPURM210S_08124 [Streptomyces purpurascens]
MRAPGTGRAAAVLRLALVASWRRSRRNPMPFVSGMSSVSSASGMKTTAVVPPYGEGCRETRTFCRWASRLTTNRPSRSVSDSSNSGVSASRRLASRSASAAIPRPRSWISRVKPLATRSPRTWTAVCGGEDRGVLQEFGHEMGEVGDGRAGDGDPRKAADLDAFVVLDLGDGGAYDVHELDGLAPRRGGAAPERITRPSACRRMRVVRWSRRNRSASSSVSSVRRSMASSRVSCRWSRTWLRRARLTKTSETPARSSACLTAASTAARCRVLRAWPTSPISFLSYSRCGTSVSTSTCSPAESRRITLGSRTPDASWASRRSCRRSRMRVRPTRTDRKSETRSASRPSTPAMTALAMTPMATGSTRSW